MEYENDYSYALINPTTHIGDIAFYSEEELNYWEKYVGQFIKIGKDAFLKYGDGGESELKVPLYYTSELAIPEMIRLKLIKNLDILGEKRKDWHLESPVLDIIDPDLNPNYFFKASPPKIKPNMNYWEKQEIQKQLEEDIPPTLERKKYAWFPVDVLITPEKNVRILGEIRNLDPEVYKELYVCIFSVFKAMLPGFEKMNLLKAKENTKLQIVVKAQKYLIQPNSSYSGKWHVEGVTENIVAVGVYYSKIDDGFEKDKLVFRTKISPDNFYSQYCYASFKETGEETEEGVEARLEYEIDITEKCALVFSNDLPHRFLELKNLTQYPLERMFLNIFVVDPSQPLESTTNYTNVKKILQKKLPEIPINTICSFLFSKMNEKDAIQKRSLSRESLKYLKNGWGYIHYGNSGDVEFISEETTNYKLKGYDRIEDHI